MAIVVFFDGVCGLCNQSVDYLIKNDVNLKFKYSPLQGAEIQKHNSDFRDPKPDSLLVWDGQKLLFKSKAWLFLMKELGGGHKLISCIISIFPYAFLDIFYDLIARYRYKIFGKKETCRIPSPEERSLFLD